MSKAGKGWEISQLPIHKRVRLGLCRSFQVVNVFPDLTVFDNIQIPVLAVQKRATRLFRPVSGEKMAHEEVRQVLENIKRLSAEGKTTFVIVEHDMDSVFSLSDRVIVLHHGDIIADGTTDEIQDSKQVREVYLGEEVLE